MSTSNDLKQLEAEVLQLEDAIQANNSALKRAARTSIGLGLALLVVIVCFLFLNLAHLRGEMTQEKLTRSLSQELTEVSPLALRELNQLGQELLPIFIAEFRKQLETAWPDVAQRVQDELNRLSDNLFAEAHELVSASEHRILESTSKALFDCYPQLNDQKHRNALEQRIHGICEEAIVQSLQTFDSLFSRDVARVESALLQFDVTDNHESPADLQKRFIHLWLQLLDQELMEL
jgi:hypothetical protein